jgi:hypothetical protein
MPRTRSDSQATRTGKATNKLAVYGAPACPPGEGKCGFGGGPQSWHRDHDSSPTQKYSPAIYAPAKKDGRWTPTSITQIFPPACASNDRVRVLGGTGARLHPDSPEAAHSDLEQDTRWCPSTSSRCGVAQHCSRPRWLPPFRIPAPIQSAEPIRRSNRKGCGQELPKHRHVPRKGRRRSTHVGHGLEGIFAVR